MGERIPPLRANFQFGIVARHHIGSQFGLGDAPNEPSSFHLRLLFMIGEYGLLTCQMDVFALGIMFHEYLTGEIPRFNEEEYDYPCEALLEDDVLILSDKLDAIPGMKQLIGWMLEKDAARRIPMLNVFEQLGGDPDRSFGAVHEGPTPVHEEGSYKEAHRPRGTGGGGFHQAGAGDLL